MKANQFLAATVAIVAAIILAASGVLGCDEGHGQNATEDAFVGDNGPDTNPCPAGYFRLYKADGSAGGECVPEWDATSDVSAATETDTAAAPNPCVGWEWLEGTKWTCMVFDDPTDCVISLWVDTDDQGVDHCVIELGWTGRYVENLLWGTPPSPTSFIVPASGGSRPDTTCNLKEE
jgi:hypothetical protein